MSLRYREVLPAPPLRRYIECFWFLQGRATGGAGEHILPDGCMELTFNLGGLVFQEETPQPRNQLVGQMDRFITIRPTGVVDIVGVRLQPAGAFPFLRLPLSELRNRLDPLEDFRGGLAGELTDRLSEAHTLARRARALDAILCRPLPSETDDGNLRAAVDHVVARAGNVSVDELSRRLGLSGRQLERRFRERVGLAPKRFARILRFQSVFRSGKSSAGSWAAVAAECGYYDQAHFIREFKSFTGDSPARFFANESPLTRHFTRSRRGRVSTIRPGH